MHRVPLVAFLRGAVFSTFMEDVFGLKAKMLRITGHKTPEIEENIRKAGALLSSNGRKLHYWKERIILKGEEFYKLEQRLGLG